MSEKIAEKLINIGSVQFSFDNHFTLTSGLKSPVYVDCRRIISFVEERDFIMGEAINYFQKNDLQFDLIAGGETAGIPYAAIISEKTKKPMLYIRKKPKGFGKNQQIEGVFKKKENAICRTLDVLNKPQRYWNSISSFWWFFWLAWYLLLTSYPYGIIPAG